MNSMKHSLACITAAICLTLPLTGCSANNQSQSPGVMSSHTNSSIHSKLHSKLQNSNSNSDNSMSNTNSHVQKQNKQRDAHGCVNINSKQLNDTQRKIIKMMRDVEVNSAPQLESSANGLEHIITNKLNGNSDAVQLVQAFALGATLTNSVCVTNNTDGGTTLAFTLATKQEGNVMSVDAQTELNRLLTSNITTLNGYKTFTKRTFEKALTWPN